MQKKKLILGLSAFALILAVLLTGCASTDQQALKKEGIPDEQRANLYLIYQNHRLEKIDGKKQGYFTSLYGALGGWAGVLKDIPKYNQELDLTDRGTSTTGRWPIQVSAGEHTIVISDEGLVGRRNYEGTYNFEAGKSYLIQLVTVSEYETMMKDGGLAEAVAGLGASIGQAITGKQVIIITESKKAKPTWRDSTIADNSWVKISKDE